MSLRGTLAVAAYSLAGGLFRYTAEEPLSQFWWSLTAIRIGCCLALERVLAAFPVVRFVITAGLMVEAYTHNVRGRIPTDRLSQGLALVTGATAGIGFQLTNICRDVMDDAAIGRVYLPEDWLREHGVEPQSISAPEHRGAVFAVASRVLDIAESYYDSAYYGLRELPFRAACAIGTARRVYREIGRQVARARSGTAAQT